MAKKRIPAAEYWQIVDAIEAGKKLGKEWHEWKRAYVKSLGGYLDEFDFESGLISKLGVGGYTPIGHMPQDDLDVAREKMDTITKTDADIGHQIQVTARRYGLRPDQLEIKTGEIKEKDFEIIEEKKEEEDA